MAKEIWTVQRMLDWSKKYLEEKGIDSPALDAQILLGYVMNMSRMQMILDAQHPMSEEELASYKAVLIQRAKDRMPVAYILGHKEFWSLDLDVSPAVLIPRPDTECLVEHAQAFALAKLEGRAMPQTTHDFVYEAVDPREVYYQNVEAIEKARALAEAELENAQNNTQTSPQDDTENTSQSTGIAEDTQTTDSVTSDIKPTEHAQRRYRILDVGTGSGAVALALRSELPEICDVYAVDISPEALKLAQKNAEKHHLDVHFALSDLLDQCEGQFDLIVSNPPYITTDEMLALAPEVKNEPTLALEAGVEGLDVYRRLVPQAFERLHNGGGLFVEIGCTQGEKVSEIFQTAGFTNVQVFRDYGRNPRVVSGIKPEEEL